MSPYDTTTSKFLQTVKIQHTHAFTLRPIIISAGPLAGCRALILDPIEAHFRFMDLPPGLR